MKIEIGKTYLTRNGRFVKLDCQPWAGVFNGDYENDGRYKGFGTDCGRWKEDGRAWNFYNFSGEFYIPEEDIIMSDSITARELAEKMKLERKQKAYDETI